MQSKEEGLNCVGSFIDQNFDFEEWQSLYKNDPVLFEKRRKKLINQFVDLSPKRYRPRLKILASRVDEVRDQSASPETACAEILSMMQNSVSDLRYFIVDLNYSLTEETQQD